MAKSVSQRIAGDRGVAGFFALVASLVPLAGVAAMAYLGYAILTDQEDPAAEGGYILLALLAVFAFIFFIVSRWTYASVRAGMTPQRVQAMWLRRFQAERGPAFRTSHVIDQLSRHGIAALTLQDRDVQLSFEQRRNRLAPVFWFLFIPLAALIAYLIWQGWLSAQADIMDLPRAQTLQQGIGQAFGAFFALIAVALILIAGLFFGLMAALVIVALIALLAGPLGAMLSKNRDDFRHLPNLLRRIQRGKGRRGAAIVRISDENWRAAVAASLAAVDVAIIDISDVSDHVAWEIGEAAKACGADGLVFICRDGVSTDATRGAARAALGRDPGAVVTYPARQSDGGRFARALREQIYAAADRRAATRA
jgi:hypothetical protein